MSDKLLKDGLRTSEKIGGLSVFAELLFIRLLLATCPLGRCPWSPDWILKHALPNRPRTRPTAIAEALQALLSAQLVARYHAPDGTAYLTIPNHGQRFKHAVRSPWPAPPSGPPDAAGQTFMALPGEVEEKRRGEGAREARGPRPPSPSADFPTPEVGRVIPNAPRPAPRSASARAETDKQWLARIAAEWPGVNVLDELAKAHRKRRGDVERGWFERVWLPGVTPKAPLPFAASASERTPAPADWRDRLEELYPGNAINSDHRGWETVPPEIREKIQRSA